MRTSIMLTTIGLIGVLSTQAYGEGAQNSEKNDCHPGKIFVEGIDLSSEQEDLLKDLRAVKKEHRGERRAKTHWKAKYIETMVGFVDGALSREDIHQEIDQSYNRKTTKISEMQESLFDLLDSYTLEQLDQVSANVEEKKECGDKYSKYSEKQGQSGRKGHKGKVLFRDLDLSDSQEGLLAELHKAEKEGKNNPHKRFRSEQKELLEGFIAGDLDRREIDKMFKEKLEERLDSGHERADLMMDLLETFSAEQKEQFLVNAEEV